MTLPSTLPELLRHVQRLATLSSAAEVLAATGHELMRVTGAPRALASCCVPGHAWEHGVHVEASPGRPALSAPARSALFAIHRRLARQQAPLLLGRGDDTRAIFEGLACDDSVTMLLALPIIHRTRRLWGEMVLLGDERLCRPPEGVEEIAQLASVALENAQRLAFARRDQDRLMLLAEATTDALYDWDFDTRDFWWGGGILKLIGASADPVQNTPRWKLDRIHPEDEPRVRAAFEEARESKAMTWSDEYRFQRQDGSYIHVEDRGYFLRDVGGRAYRIIGSVRDITTIKSLLLRERQARAEAEAASRAKDEFLAMLGHELRNPLAPITTAVDLLRLRAGQGTSRELTVIERQTQHMIRLVDDLLDISRIAHGKIQLAKERLEIGEVVIAAIETTRPLLERRGHSVDVRVARRGVAVYADRARLTQAIANLLNNAAKYTEPGGTITVIGERDGDAVEIIVRDNGIGIAPDMLARIFQMFVQERQALDRAQGGLGLGLSIVRSLVDLHGGHIEASSAGEGKGAQFTIRLPAADAVTEFDAEALTQPVCVEVPRGRKIMVVDDNEDAADLLSVALEQLGNTIRIAHDAHDAFRLLEEFTPDLAVLDIGLPEIDGYELARKLRDQHGDTLRLIALTGYGQDADRERAVSAGFDAHLVKPVEITKLRSLIEDLTAD